VAISTELIPNASQQDELAAISQSRSVPAGYVFRAKLILMLAEGASFRTIKHKLGTTAPTIVRWKERFLSSGIDGLDTYHPGQPPSVLTPTLRARVLAATGKSQPMDRRTGVAANSRPIWASAKMWCTGCGKKRA
jgi:transposase